MTTPGGRASQGQIMPSLYAIACLGALAALFFLLLQRVHEPFRPWAVFPVVVGVLGVIFRWRSAPILFLAVLAGYYYVGLPRTIVGLQISLDDWLASAAVLAYVAAHYRLQGISGSLFPDDARRGGRGRPKAEWVGRGRPVSNAESGQFLLAVALWAAVGQILFRLLPAEVRYLGLPPRISQLLLLTWLLGVAFLLAAGAFGYLRFAGLSRQDATLFLQDTMWYETRREQRRWHQWRVWGRLRQQRREERR
jgi:hypothetical protein